MNSGVSKLVPRCHLTPSEQSKGSHSKQCPFLPSARRLLYILTRRSYRDFHPLSYVLSRYQIGPAHWNAARNWTTSLQELRLYPNLRFPEFIDIISASYPFIDGHLFPKLNKLALYSRDFLEPEEQIYMRKTAIQTFVLRLNKNLGVTAKLEGVLLGPAQDGLLETAALESDVWFWQAPKLKSFASIAWEKGRLHRQDTVSSERP
jgi:hypothetical protein